MNEFNSLSPAEAERRLRACLASQKWAHRVADGRPYAELGALLEAAERGWSELVASDWAEALAGHPRIGERGGSSPAASEREQSRMRQAGAEVLAQLAGENRAYEARFGHVFLIAAEGKDADEILAALRLRMGNDPVSEALVAAAELRKIARHRLEALAQG